MKQGIRIQYIFYLYQNRVRDQSNITRVEKELYSFGLVWKISQTGAVGKSSSTNLILCYIFTTVNFLHYLHKFVLFKLVKGSLSYQN